uniref:Uncharacterized protein n=1 Tax=Rhizophora mucronata TaxID=61149 RepID=A0A2P2PV04_RHIMU
MATTGCTDIAFWIPRNITVAYIEPIALNMSCLFVVLEPRSQNIVPNIKAITVVKSNLTAV